jgi:outer membrane receptor protein involved in Fe transport/Flp pilus assembly protein TadD
MYTRWHRQSLSIFAGRRWTFLAHSLLLLMLAVLPGASGAEAKDTGTATVLTVEGKVELARKDNAQWTAAGTNDVLHPGDRVRTGLRSRATLRWSEMSVVRVNQLTTMELQPPRPGADKPQLDLKTGATYFFSRERPDEIHFQTPVASGAIRGTEFHLKVDENGQSELALLDGEVALQNARGEVILKSGEQGIVQPDQPPRKTAMIDALNIIQWVLYYPAVIDTAELGLTSDEEQTFSANLKAYREGDLLRALNLYPEGRQPASDAERALQAALLMAAGQVANAETSLKAVQSPSPTARALQELIAAVKNQTITHPAQPASASEWLARSYYLQSRSQLKEALAAAEEATRKSPRFGAAWIRRAELEFGFGRTSRALEALETGLGLSRRNAQALALRGFLWAAKNNNSEAARSFDEAIALDGALGNAWLGRGLVKIRRGHAREGREDLQVAATLEPQRAVLRSYLGKAFNQTWDIRRAEKELQLAQKLDPNDPTAWLYSALLKEQGNRVNEAVSDLEKSKELNDNRSIFRSRLLLDQDRAVRSANLASIYRDAGMFDVSVQEASRAVNYDYANYSAHLFLANSYDYLRDPNNINLRYEAPWFSELLVANLLAPASGGSLSRNISQQEYSEFFEGNHLGVFSSTEYRSSGDWSQAGSQYGVIGTTSYSLDASYRSENGQRPNNDLDELFFAGRFKQQFTPHDSVFLQVSWLNFESGDLSQYYNQRMADPTLRVKEKQEPNVIAGYHHEWAPGNDTLLLAARFDDTLTLRSSAPQIPFYASGTGVFPPFEPYFTFDLTPDPLSLKYRRELEAYFAEIQHIWQAQAHTVVAGARYQTASADTISDLTRQPLAGAPQSLNTEADADLDRIGFYAYENWQIFEQLRLTAGLSYDRLHYPRNIDTSPIIDAETTTDKWSPKAGVLWTPGQETYVRAFYSQSLGGVFFDNSVRLEPTQIAGFNQAYRSLIPESVVGLVPGTRFENFGVGFDKNIRTTGTYLTIDGEILRSDATRTLGILVNNFPPAPEPNTSGSTRQSLDYEEKTVLVAVNQLLSKEYALGARYRLTYADLEERFTDVSAQTTGTIPIRQDLVATLHQVWLHANFNHPSGFFAVVSSVWSSQSNQGYGGSRPGDDFWQHNAAVGYRFLRRHVEASVGVLNLTDEDYQLNPLNLYNELPRERTLVANLKFYF